MIAFVVDMHVTVAMYNYYVEFKNLIHDSTRIVPAQVNTSFVPDVGPSLCTVCMKTEVWLC